MESEAKPKNVLNPPMAFWVGFVWETLTRGGKHSFSIKTEVSEIAILSSSNQPPSVSRFAP